MSEIGEAAVGNAGKEAGAFADRQRIPSDVGNFFARSKTLAHFRESGEASAFRRFRASGEEPLQANADAEEGHAGGDTLLNGGFEAVVFEKLRCGKMADAGQNDLLADIGWKRDEA